MLTNEIKHSLIEYIDKMASGISEDNPLTFNLSPSKELQLTFDDLDWLVEEYRQLRPALKVWACLNFKDQMIRVKIYKQLEK